MCMCMCMCIFYIYVYIYICIYIYAYMHTHICICAYIYICTYIYEYHGTYLGCSTFLWILLTAFCLDAAIINIHCVHYIEKQYIFRFPVNSCNCMKIKMNFNYTIIYTKLKYNQSHQIVQPNMLNRNHNTIHILTLKYINMKHYHKYNSRILHNIGNKTSQLSL